MVNVKLSLREPRWFERKLLKLIYQQRLSCNEFSRNLLKEMWNSVVGFPSSLQGKSNTTVCAELIITYNIMSIQCFAKTGKEGRGGWSSGVTNKDRLLLGGADEAAVNKPSAASLRSCQLTTLAVRFVDQWCFTTHAGVPRPRHLRENKHAFSMKYCASVSTMDTTNVLRTVMMTKILTEIPTPRNPYKYTYKKGKLFAEWCQSLSRAISFEKWLDDARMLR